jgi:hypothetical protein
MAILVDFQKVREDNREVEYRFGLVTGMDRRLVIQKESQEGAPLDGARDPAFAGAYVKILRSYRSLGTWPERGAYAA